MKIKGLYCQTKNNKKETLLTNKPGLKINIKKKNTAGGKLEK